MTQLRYHPDVLVQVREIGAWWRKNTSRPGLFAEEWKRARLKLKAMPLIGPPVPDEGPDAHCLLLRGTQHYVYYRYVPPPADVVRVVMVWSNHRGSRPQLPR